MTEYDLLVRDGYLADRDRVVDIAVDGGDVVRIAPDVEGTAAEVIDAGGNLVGPGFVECHLHIDKAFGACGDRRPRGNEGSFTFERVAELEAAYNERASVEDIERNAIQNVEMAVAAGSTFVRSHVYVGDGRGVRNMEAAVRARERTAHLADVQLVVSGGDLTDPEEEATLREAVELGLEDATDQPVLLGGADPATRHTDVEGSLDTWYSLAEEYDVGMDLHIQDGGTLGVYTLDRLVEYAREYGYEDRVTASHCYCMAHVHDEWQDEMVEKFLDVGMKLVTCYQSTRPTMPVRKLLTEGVALGHGTDNDRDFVFPHGNADALEGALVESNKLHGDRTFVEDYRWFDSNEGLAALWEMITENGAEVLGVAEEYGVAEGNPANLVVFDRPSPQWAILTQATRTHVVKDGAVVARDGDLLDEQTVVGGYDDVLEPPVRGAP
jgi:cytosine/adenosine deaminase-related metal-dependent hydrolase